MKVLLQNKTSRLFLLEASSWTGNLEEAFGFLNSGEAIDFAMQHQLTDLHVVLWFREQNYSLVIPFEKDSPEEPAQILPPPSPHDRKRLR